MTSASAPTDATVVIGGGFGGMSAIQTLRHRHPDIPVVLIEPRERFVFQPLLYELLSGELQPWEVAPGFSQLTASLGVSWLKDSVIGVNTQQRTLTMASGLTLRFRQLLITAGSERNDYGTPGVRDHSLSFRDDHDVRVLRERIEALKQRSSDAAMVIVGAGATGVELACKLADLLDGAAALHLIEMGGTILPNSTAFNREQAVVALERRNITVHLNTAVTNVQNDQVVVQPGAAIRHQGLIWTAGSQAVSIPIEPGPRIERGRLSIESTLRLIGEEAVFAIGDISTCSEERWPATAQVAMQQGEAAATALASERHGGPLQPFQFVDRGEMLSLGLGDATLTGMGLTLSGPIAFQIRRATYLTRLPGASLGLRSAGAWLLGR